MKKGDKILLIVICAIVAIGAGVGIYIKSSSGLDSCMSIIMSESMQHDNNQSSIGTIDTGDIIINYSPDNAEIHTYISSYTGDKYKSFGDYGSVITYTTEKNANPIIHRAIVELEWNSTNNCWQSPELENYSAWYTEDGSKTSNDCMHLTGTLVFTDLTQSHKKVTINLDSLDKTVSGKNCKGYLTLGDNPVTNLSFDEPTKISHPVTADEIKSVAKYEIPWFGVIKVWQDANKRSNLDHVPNSITSMAMVIIAIFVLIISMDIFSLYRKINADEKRSRRL